MRRPSSGGKEADPHFATYNKKHADKNDTMRASINDSPAKGAEHLEV
jgi:hypothetical protein